MENDGGIKVRVFVHQRVEKALKQMAALDNAPRIAAHRARTIIEKMRGGSDIRGSGRLSVRKDARIRRLYKFNLGKGYRLVSVREKNAVYVLFIGSHDSCDRWLADNSKKRPHRSPGPVTRHDAKPSNPDLSDKTPKACVNDDAEKTDPIPPEISQKVLRKVFSGLTDKT
jgi:mRNA-degrading endonuclease RelE of RelBE toxin-antitoxin system